MQALDKWHKTKTGYLVFGIVELALSYLFISLALDSAHTWQYVLSILLLIGGVHNLIKIFRAPKK